MNLRGNENYVWDEKYRARTIDEVILPDAVKAKFKEYISNKQLPHLLFYSRQPGVGKTTTALALCNDIGISEHNTLFINASLESSIDLLRDKIEHFASTVGFDTVDLKAIILDEVDGAGRGNSSFFDALRPMLEKYSGTCSFIMTCNYIDKIPEAIKSRTTQFEYSIDNKQEYAMKLLARLEYICNQENLEYDKKVLAEIVKRCFPDMRSMIVLLQQFKDELKNETLKYKLTGIDVRPLIDSLKNKKFDYIKDFVINEIQSTDEIYRKLFDSLKEFLMPESIPAAILVIDDYMRHHSNVVDTQIHVIAFLIDFAGNVKFK